MDLTQAMLAATEDPPPTAIDVDQLITGEHRRTRRLRTITGVALVAVLVVGVAVAPQLLARPPSAPTSEPSQEPECVVLSRWGGPTRSISESEAARPGQGINPSEIPKTPIAESCAAAEARLGAQLSRLLPAAMPGVTFTEGLPAKVAKNTQVQVGYQATFTLPDGKLSVSIRALGDSPQRIRDVVAAHCQPGPDQVCRGETVGEVELFIQTWVGRGSSNVGAVRPDGTSVEANYLGDGDVAAIERQLVQLVTAPELTLYP